jgi:hypothetical protein
MEKLRGKNEYMKKLKNEKMKENHPRQRISLGGIGVAVLACFFLATGCGSFLSFPGGNGTPAASSASPQAATGTSAAAASTLATTPTSAATITPTATDFPTMTPTQFAVNPLTGLPVSNLASVLRRPIGIKVSNYPRTARPQAGLTDADILIEYYQEAGDSRFHAIYLGTDSKKVGPIRSGRVVDGRLEQVFQSILVFNAADYRVWASLRSSEDIIRNTMVYRDEKDCPAICIDSSQAEINRFYVDTAALRTRAKAFGITDIAPDLSGWTFQETPPAMEKEVPNVHVRYLTNWATAEWRYNTADHLYYRWSDTDKTPIEGKGPLNLGPLIDRNNQKQITAANIIVLLTNYDRQRTIEIYDVNFYGSGTAFFFRDGKMETGSWRMPNSNRLPHFFGNSSTGSYMLRPGVSWITLVDDQSTVSVVGDMANVEFSQPG